MPNQQPHIYSFPSVADLAPSLCKYIISQQDTAIHHNGSFRVAVSGGSLPKTLATALLSKGDGTVKWDTWKIFFADERCVPLDHDDSNYKLLKDELLDKIPADEPKPEVHTITRTSQHDDADEAADAYEKVLISTFAKGDSVKFPVFDLVLLGCGPDGHTCSLFPNHALLHERDAWVLGLSDSPKPPPKRITLSLPVVLHATSIAFVATGAGKRDLLKCLFETDEGKALPCGLVNAGAPGKVSWFTDHAATEGVNVPMKGSL